MRKLEPWMFQKYLLINSIKNLSNGLLGSVALRKPLSISVQALVNRGLLEKTDYPIGFDKVVSSCHLATKYSVLLFVFTSNLDTTLNSHQQQLNSKLYL